MTTTASTIISTKATRLPHPAHALTFTGPPAGPVRPPPIPVPTTRPVLRLHAPRPLRHTLRLAGALTPGMRRMPPGAVGAEIRVTVAPPGSAPPADAGCMRFYTVARESPVRIEFALGDAGSVASYAARWVGAGGEAGPWSPVLTGRVGG